MVKTDEDMRQKIVDNDDTNIPEDADGEETKHLHCLGRIRIANQRYNDYELYTTVSEEEHFISTTNCDTNKGAIASGKNDIGNGALKAVACFIMMHYVEK